MEYGEPYGSPYSLPIGILNPTSLFFKENDVSYIYGKKGKAIIGKDKDEFIYSLIAAGSIIFGSESSIFELNKILLNPEYSRTFSYLCNVGEDCEEIIEYLNKIKKAKVLFLGCGGIGSFSALLLAGIGIRYIRVVEFDKIEKSNLNRQLFFTKKEIGKYKADVIKSCIEDRFDDVHVEVIKEQIIESNIEKYFDGGITSAFVTADDPIDISKKCQLVANKLSIPLINAGYLTNMSIINYSPKLNDLISETTNIQVERLPNSIMPSYGPTNLEVAGYATSVLLQAILGKIKTNTPLYDTWNNTEFPRKKI